MTEKLIKKSENRSEFIFLAVVFSAPFLVAWLIYYHTDFGLNGETSNYGELISPPLPLLDVPLLEIETSSLNLHLHGKWSLVYLSSDQCLSICQQRLIMLQNLRVSTGSNAERIRVILAMKNPENKVNSNELVNGLDWKNIQLLSRSDIKPENDNDIQARKYLSDLDTGVYLIDPLGNLMMKYTLNIESAGIMQDLKRLLRYSRIG